VCSPKVVDADQQTRTDQSSAHGHYLVGGLACNEALDDTGGHWRCGDQVLDLLTTGDSKQSATQHSLPPFADALRFTFCKLPRL
jgi:hypothetical protein